MPVTQTESIQESIPTENAAADLIQRQRAYFQSGATLALDFRKRQLRQLKLMFQENEGRILEALAADLGKPAFEAFASEIGLVYEEINFSLKHLKNWLRPRRVSTPITIAPSRSEIHSEPRGVTLIIGAWNYPIQLIGAPLIGALAAGDTAVLKPSELATASARLLEELIPRYFSPEYVFLANGGIETTTHLLNQKFDLIFFTGSTTVGRIVAQAAARHLTPAILELGGKSPAIVDPSANLTVTARRIAWGKYFNAGQTCVAPDYVLVPAGQRAELVEKIQAAVLDMFGPAPAESRDYCRIINTRHFDRLTEYLNQGDLVFGGQHDRDRLFMAPTLLEHASETDSVMRNEIFGPILPVVEYSGDPDEAIRTINARPNPLALYIFSENKSNTNYLLERLPFGGGCVNDTLVHLGNPHLPFGGRGDSGMGRYHGVYSFDAFSHQKSVVRTPTFVDLPLRYAPYRDKMKLLKWIFR